MLRIKNLLGNLLYAITATSRRSRGVDMDNQLIAHNRDKGHVIATLKSLALRDPVDIPRPRCTT